MAPRTGLLDVEPGNIIAVREAIEQLCEPGVIEAHVQPVVRAADQLVVGYESLARMPFQPVHPPDWWLARAEDVGLRSQLEIACLRAATELGPTPDGRLLFVNLSPSLLANVSALDLLDELPDRLVIELTEQEAVGDYEELRRDLAPWLSRGVRIAIDDTGAGYSSLRHVIELTPDFLKLDRELVRDLDHDRNRRALVSAVVAFAGEVGTSVIAEGVETATELEVLRDAEVDLVQGYLLARPGPAWPSVAPSIAPDRSPFRMTVVRAPGAGSAGPETRLAESIERATEPARACSVVVEHLFRQGQIMPSIYLERHGELRCIAQRGLWQILDGMSGSAGITGRTWKSGQPIVVPDVSQHTGYLEAIPGVVSEICVPVTIDDRTIGALNVESLTPLPPGMLEQLEAIAALLARRLKSIGEHPEESSWDRIVQASIAISGVADTPTMPGDLVRCLRDASRMDSAAVIVDGAWGPSVTTAVGPLERGLHRLTTSELSSLSSLVNDIRSCYTGGDAVGRGFVGSASLRDGGARVVVVLPLWAQRVRLGSVVLAHSRPLQLDGEEIRALETLADHVASALASSRHLHLPIQPGWSNVGAL
jgi:EAL domain-containing protein (putative c-di-GMP-specific phosphodiesterase class I)/putative methionine-R-sulfoxide reductase with GAF domain